ncbi:MAG: dihydroorotase [Bacteroidia bacterium]|nr:dihydroorotase [Bacteroidia bacterium]
MLIKSVTIVDSTSVYNNKVCDVLIENGLIKTIANTLNPTGNLIDGKGLYLSTGWFDMGVNFCDPGMEHKEDLITGCNAAKAGGFTDVALMPSTIPAIQSKAQVDYILSKTQNHEVNVHPIGAVTLNTDGTELTEMYDMQQAGAVAFSNHKNTITNSGVMQRAMLYIKNINSTLLSFAEDKSLTGQNMVNESAQTTMLGFKGIPAIAEEIMVMRDIQLCSYTQTPIHISRISTAGSVQLIAQARKNGLPVTCDVAAYNLYDTDAALQKFDSNYKVKPPLRSAHDVAALIDGLVQGVIDIIVSDHTPQDVEAKKVEFDYAEFGMIGCESFFGIVFKCLAEKMPLDKIIETFTTNPRKILKLPVYSIAENQPACLTLFSLDDYCFSNNHIQSKSNNTPYIGSMLKGKAINIFTPGN